MFQCNKCKQKYSKWTGKCTSCDEWNSLEECFDDNIKQKKKTKVKLTKEISPLSSLENDNTKLRINKTCFDELNLVLGGGIIDGQFLLLGGEPGIGKSTLVMQIGLGFSKKGETILYISGEESALQIKRRADRVCTDKKSLDNFYAVNETRLEAIIPTIEKLKPNLVIVDSIQTTYSLDISSPPGSVSQIRYIADKLMEIVKTRNIPLFLIGHVTKDGDLAGPKTLEHIVDTVLNIEGDRFHTLRFVRSSKNRFGPVDEVGIFNLEEKGLIEVNNSNQFIQNEKPKDSFGSGVSCAMEGSRPFLIEVQALTNTTNFGYPKRTSAGIKLNRVQLLLAVLQKYSKLKLENQDVYINIAGGMTINDPALDLSTLLSIASSFLKKKIPSNIGILGEVGLSGEIREIPYLNKRITEMSKAGISEIICPKTKTKINSKVKLRQISSVKEALEILS